MICYKCKQDKSDEEFGADKTRFHHREYICSLCKNERSRKYYRNNKEALNIRRRARWYKLSNEDYNNLLTIQNSLCAICFAKADLVIDHDHNTGKVRGLLCSNCNLGLGLFKEDLNLLKHAHNYLEQVL